MCVCVCDVCICSSQNAISKERAFLNASSLSLSSYFFLLFSFLHKLLKNIPNRVLHAFGKRLFVFHFYQRSPHLLLHLLEFSPDVFETTIDVIVDDIVLVVLVTIVICEHSSDDSGICVFHRFVFNHNRRSSVRMGCFILWKLWKQIASRKEEFKFLQLQLLLIRANRAGEFTFVHLCATLLLFFLLYINNLGALVVITVFFIGYFTSRPSLDQFDDVRLDGILDG
mmetsp:Transcript_1772/g.5393  ORF Transcript_1772/g.5393 Transcript_1772/m.5393 type:complete len:226 (-) Transcript_1772:617-1294(-)